MTDRLVCERKTHYPSRKAARRKAKLLARRWRQKLVPYYCHVCKGHHLTTHPELRDPSAQRR